MKDTLLMQCSARNHLRLQVKQETKSCFNQIVFIRYSAIPCSFSSHLNTISFIFSLCIFRCRRSSNSLRHQFNSNSCKYSLCILMKLSWRTNTATCVCLHGCVGVYANEYIAEVVSSTNKVISDINALIH